MWDSFGVFSLEMVVGVVNSAPFTKRQINYEMPPQMSFLLPIPNSTKIFANQPLNLKDVLMDNEVFVKISKSRSVDPNQLPEDFSLTNDLSREICQRALIVNILIAFWGRDIQE